MRESRTHVAAENPAQSTHRTGTPSLANADRSAWHSLMKTWGKPQGQSALFRGVGSRKCTLIPSFWLQYLGVKQHEPRSQVRWIAVRELEK